ncbi:MAG: YitT family protein [Clostridiaceae bacterium]|nr:YitT family protein [Clostridiaceae bacterium]
MITVSSFFVGLGKIMWKVLVKIGRILIGTFCMALAVNLVYEPMDMVTGGVSGLAIAVKELTRGMFEDGIPVWLTNLAVNLPIFLAGYFVMGKKYLGYTFFANLAFSAFLYVLPVLPIPQKDFFLASLYGGVLTGFGLGLVLMAGLSTGGADLLSSILHQVFPRLSVTSVLFVLDASVIVLGIAVFGMTPAAYAIFAAYLSSKIADNMISGLRMNKQVWIISEQYTQISSDILTQMDRGVTCIEGQGMYSRQSKKILMCVVGRTEIVDVVRLIRKRDAGAFVIIQNTHETMGEGFERNANL